MMYLGIFIVLTLFHHEVRGVQLETVKAFATFVGQRIKEEAINTIHEGVTLTQKPDLVLRYMADTIVTTTLLGCLQLIPNKVDIPPLDLDLNLSGPGHLLADKGRLQGLSSMKVRPIIYNLDDNGDILITFPITFTDLHVVYDQFRLNCWPIIMTGAADIKFADSEVNLNIRLTRPSDLLEKIASRECVFHVGTVQFRGFQEMEPNIRLDGKGDHKFLSEHVFPVVAAEIKKVVLHMVDVRVTNSLCNSLPLSGSWVCRDPVLKRLTLQTTGPVAFTMAGVANWLPDSTTGSTTDLDFDSSATMDTDIDNPVIDVYPYDDVL